MKSSNPILDANGGLHSKRAMKKVKDRLENHGMKRAILVHIVLTGSQSVQVYRDTYNDIADHLRDHGSKTEYFGCLEMDEIKGLHAHVFYVIETSKKFPHLTLDVTDGGFLHRLAERRNLNRLHIAKPQNKIHNANGKPQLFARLTAQDGKLEDCLKRIEYLYKKRSKKKVPSREIYFNSNFEANKAKRVAKKKPASLPPSAALPAAKENAAPIPTPTLAKEVQNEEQFETQTKAAGSSSPGNFEASSPSEASASNERDSSSRAGTNQQIEPISREGVHTTKGDEMQLTEAGFKYLATQYETCVDQGMDIVQIQRYLSSKGISRSLREVKHELNNVFCFAGYAAAHPAPPLPDLVRLDAAIDRTPLRSSDSWLSRVYSREPSKLSHKPSSIGLTVSEPPGIIEPLTQMSQLRSYPA